MEDLDVSVDDSEIESPKSRQQMSVKRKKMSFKDNLLQMVEGQKVEDPVSSFLMSLAPQIRLLCQEKQNEVFIEFLQAIQRVSFTNPNQSTYIPPINNNVSSLPIQHPTSTFVSAANPHQSFNYYTNLSQTVSAPGSPLTELFIKTEED